MSDTENKEALRTGQRVPDFELTTFDPSKGTFGNFSLSENRKNKRWTVLVFYPADYTFVCPTELADVGAAYTKIKELGAEVVSVSTDTQFVHMAWQRDEKLLKDIKYPMGADTTGKISRLFGVYDENTGLALRGTFIINPDGDLVGSEVNFYNVGRNADELLRKVKAFVHVRNNPEEVCPAKWDDGAKTLKPGGELVGRVAEALK
jgi:peroxiredoxin (alkyl hydroperoxide reductase subunit C)